MAHPKLDRPDVPLAQLLAEAEQLGIGVEVVPDINNWPLWPVDHPYRHSSCEKKSPYLHLEGAVAAAITYARTRGTVLRVYACPHGVHYHLTRLRAWVESPYEEIVDRDRIRRKPRRRNGKPRGKG